MTVSATDFTASLLDPDAATPMGLQTPTGDRADKRFNVYRNNVASGLSDALETAFPVVRKLVGDQFFRATAGVYLRRHPPASPLMMFYGAEMPAFLRQFTPARALPYLPDIAALELALRHAYHAADAVPVDAQALGALAPDALSRARLHLAPAIQIVASAYPIHGIYRANTVPDAPKPEMRAETVLLTRPGYDPQMHLIDTAAADFLAAIRQGVTLEAAVGTAGDGCDLAGTLQLLLSQGAVTDIY